ncbi:GxxExxY protein [Plebeiibacterium sediminum]|uniref:GxxExxY protein n=1 Tax=Plebeiibacterium sediminum TaxID=2992112 RepID=A0AAE3M6H9_9BACT|nr:GxxExxY protein [Plebeiobacterium sediminum]MCW3787745.1 GxxExxY protein [Plebeiobacterium sediminum]
MPNLLNHEFPLKKETYTIIGAAMEVHKELGCGFLENVYQEAFEYELKTQRIPYKREEKLEIKYKGLTLTKHYYADFICYDSVIIELKALSELSGEHESQVLNYLKATKNKVGLLINFGEKSLKYKRLISPFV